MPHGVAIGAGQGWVEDATTGCRCTAVAAAACAGLITLGIMQGMWYGPVMKALGDPPADNPHYYVWRTGWQMATPLAAGMITGIVILFGGSQRLVVSGLIAAFVQVVTVTLWWLARTPTARITALTLSREWQAIIICVPLGTLATAFLLGRRATGARPAVTSIFLRRVAYR